MSFCNILHSWSKRLSPWYQHVKTNRVYSMKHGLEKKFLWLSGSRQSFIWGCRCCKQRPKKPLEIMATEKDILPTTCDKCGVTVNCLHCLSFPSWLLWNLWQLCHEKTWPSVSESCGLGGGLFQYILLLLSSSALFAPSSVVILFQEKK